MNVSSGTFREAKTSDMLKELSDEELLIRIGRDEDVSAYKALYARFAPKAFCLARHLTGSKDLSEDIVQEAMLSIWTSAEGFDIKRGSARNWIMRVVANQAIYFDRKRRNERKRVEKRNAMKPVDSEIVNEPEIGAAEMQAYLRGLIANLHPDQRRLVTLYFGASLSQDEIANMLSVSQRKISLQIKKVLGHLKSHLAQAGFSASVGVEPIISQALVSGWELSSALGPRVFKQLPGRASADVTSSTLPGKLGVFGWACVVVVLIALPVGIFHAVNTQPDSMGSLPASTPDVDASHPEISIPAPRWKKTWDFNTIESMNSLTYSIKPPTFRAGRGLNGSGCVHFESHLGGAEFIVPLRKLPAKVTYYHQPDFKSKQSEIYSTHINWEHPLFFAGFRGFRALIISHKQAPWIKLEVYVTEKSMDLWEQFPGQKESKRTSLTLCPRKKNSAMLFFRSGSIYLDELTVEEISAAEVPDISKFVSAFKKYAPRSRPEKWHAIPELKVFSYDDESIQMRWFPTGTNFIKN